MFVRKKYNPSGVVSIQVIDKSKGKYQVLKTIGSSANALTIEALYIEAKQWIEAHAGRRNMFSEAEKEREEKQVTAYLLSNIENILLNGTQLILNQVFMLIGFDAIDDDILKHLVAARISQPSSKSGTVDYLKSYFDEELSYTRFIDIWINCIIPNKTRYKK